MRGWSTLALVAAALLAASTQAQQTADLLLDSTGHLGDPGELRVLGQPGRPAVLLLDTDPGPVEIPPWGTFEIGFSPSLQVFVLTLGPDGVAALPFTVPGDPGIVGLAIHAQALVEDPAGIPGPTNAVHLGVTAAPEPSPGGNPGLGRLQRPELIADLAVISLPAQESSFDRLLGNDDGFSGIWSYLFVQNGEKVLFDRPGPGLLDSFKVTFMDGPAVPIPLVMPGEDQYRLRFWLDDEPVPRIDATARGLFEGEVPGFDSPLVLDDMSSPGGAVCNVPIPFEKRLVITAGPDAANLGNPHFHAFRWRRLPAGAAIASWSGSEDLTGALDVLAAAGAGDPKVSSQSPTSLSGTAALDLSPQVFLAAIEGPGWISTLELRPTVPDPAVLQDVRLQVFYEGEATPSFDSPLGLLSGAGYTPGAVALGLFAGQRADGTIYCHYPMPFEQHADVRLVRAGTGGAVPVDWTVSWRPSAFPYEAAHLVTVHQGPMAVPDTGPDVVIASVDGRGRLVRVVVRSSQGTGGGPRLHLEGDVRLSVDLVRTPLHGTGTEDFFNWGFYDGPLDFPFTQPTHGSPEGPGLGSSWTTQYRELLNDAVDFGMHLEATIEHGPKNNVAAEYETLALLYHDPVPSLVETDLVEVGDPLSEAAHGYLVQDAGSWGPPPEWTLTGPGLPGYMFENDPWTHFPFVDAGRKLGTFAGIAFDVSVDPGNGGIRLVRLADQGLQEQDGAVLLGYNRAQVYADGVWVGTWSHPRANPLARWVEDAFDVPAGVTSGKSTVRLEFRPDPLHGWNEFRWRVYSRL